MEGHNALPFSSNCSGSLILDVLRYARIEPQVLQVELHPYLVQTALVDLAKTLNIAVTAYSSFGPQVSSEVAHYQFMLSHTSSSGIFRAFYGQGRTKFVDSQQDRPSSHQAQQKSVDLCLETCFGHSVIVTP